MYKYVSTGSFTIKAPKVKSLSEIKIDIQQFSDHIINHSIYPNGLDLTITQFADKTVYETNKRIIVDENFNLVFED